MGSKIVPPKIGITLIKLLNAGGYYLQEHNNELKKKTRKSKIYATRNAAIESMAHNSVEWEETDTKEGSG